MLCPKCHTPIDSETLSCEKRHTYHCENGVLVLIDEALRQRIETIYQHRQGVSSPLIEDYNQLPYSMASQHFEWNMRCYDADVIRGMLSIPPPLPAKQVLEIGAWNGWLTHWIARLGYSVTAIDYFAHSVDGLGAKSRYNVDWQAVQMDITDLSLFDQKFDVIILNHGLHFFTNPVSYVQQVKPLLAEGGKLILIGLTFFRDASQRIKQIDALVKSHENAHGNPLFLKPTKGYMDFEDKARLEAAGILLKRYPQLWRANLKARFLATAPDYFYGVYPQ